MQEEENEIKHQGSIAGKHYIFNQIYVIISVVWPSLG